MTDIRLPPIRIGSTKYSGEAEFTVETLAHAARYLRDRPPSADIVILESADALAPFREALEELASCAADTSSQFEYFSLTAAMEHLRGGKDVRVALLWSAPKECGVRELIGAVPYCVTYGYMGLPLPVWRVWYHVHSYLCTPLLKRGHERQAVRHFLALADGAGAAFVEFPMFEASGAFDRTLGEIVERQKRRVAETDRHERAFLKSAFTEEEYLSAHIRKKKRKEFNRLWNRLSELGEVRFFVHDGKDVEDWLSRFLRLEAAGWKGRRGTALKVDADQSAYFEKLCRRAAALGKLHCTEMTLDGKPLAMLTSFRAGDGLYTFKIAFDEAYWRYSPGVLLMLKLIGEVLRDDRISWADSCAIPGHPMIDHIWAERRAMRSVLVSTDATLSMPALRYAAAARRLAENLRAKLRKHYHAFLKEKENEQND